MSFPVVIKIEAHMDDDQRAESEFILDLSATGRIVALLARLGVKVDTIEVTGPDE